MGMVGLGLVFFFFDRCGLFNSLGWNYVEMCYIISLCMCMHVEENLKFILYGFL
jgi:hypothetical protein